MTPKRRVFPRWLVDMPVRYRRGWSWSNGRTREISEGGLSVVGPSPPLGSEIEVEFGASGDPLRLPAVIKYRLASHFGVQFLRVRRADRLSLSEILGAQLPQA